MNGFLGSFSKSFESASPGGVMRSPKGFLDCSFCRFVSTGVGRGWFGFVGMNTRLDVWSCRFFGGRYMPLRVVSAFDRIFSTFSSAEKDVAFNISSLTYFVGFMYRKSAPQKVSPRPIKAKMYEEERKDPNRATSPSSSIEYAIGLEAVIRTIIFLYLFSTLFCMD